MWMIAWMERVSALAVLIHEEVRRTTTVQLPIILFCTVGKGSIVMQKFQEK
jgi:hypothetical protein